MMEVTELQTAQDEFDRGAWEHEQGNETISHQAFHVAKDLGRLATYCEAVDHDREASTEQIDKEVIPNLLMAALRLANDRGIDIETAFKKRVEELSALHSK